jgi:hypothetical protein
MTLEEVKKYMEENKNSDEVKAYLQGLVNVEGVQTFFTQNEDGKRWLDSERDKHLNKGLILGKPIIYKRKLTKRSMNYIQRKQRKRRRCFWQEGRCL